MTKQLTEDMIYKVCVKLGTKLFVLPYINPVLAIKSKLFAEVHTGIPDILISLIPAFISKKIFSIYANYYLTTVGGCLQDYIHAAHLVKSHVNK